jgi:hypothetical protein
MFFMPFNILGMWFRGLLSIAILAGGIYLLYRWYDDSHVVEQTRVAVSTDEVRAKDVAPGMERRPASTIVTVPGHRVFRVDPGWNRPTMELAVALSLLVGAAGGRLVGRGLSMLTLRSGTSPSSTGSAYR